MVQQTPQPHYILPCSTVLYPVVFQFCTISITTLIVFWYIFLIPATFITLTQSARHLLSLLQCVAPEEITFHTGSTQQLRVLKIRIISQKRSESERFYACVRACVCGCLCAPTFLLPNLGPFQV